ncbi:LysR family transcriptional regulator [Pararhodobacter sp. SW119]|uniref:LysR family transcriptional regulator n=1 Tax=Pararhodobacter sp. SW119 TaxID=2780075 RepID=UPI001ADFE5C0|nr:LysR family transcriptional regulator [Pararhodobacter sp. SW119]
MRRTLPSTRDMCCFESVVRNGSVTRAAHELNMTQSAVSRRIGYLEEMLGQKLFIREKQRVIPTLAAQEYAESLHQLINGIEVATTRILTHGRKGGTLVLACLPTFGSRWLVPRLNRFLEDNPGIDINLVSKISRFSFEGEGPHAAIYFGEGEWPGAEMRYLMPESVVPVAAPSLIGPAPLADPAALANMTLIQHTTRPQLWREWLDSAGLATINGTVGPKFEYYALVIEAAVAGIGVALLPEFLVRREIASGLLVRAVERPMQCREAYFYVFPKKFADNPNVVCFGAWLKQEIDRFIAEPLPPVPA